MIQAKILSYDQDTDSFLCVGKEPQQLLLSISAYALPLDGNEEEPIDKVDKTVDLTYLIVNDQILILGMKVKTKFFKSLTTNNNVLMVIDDGNYTIIVKDEHDYFHMLKADCELGTGLSSIYMIETYDTFEECLTETCHILQSDNDYSV